MLRPSSSLRLINVIGLLWLGCFLAKVPNPFASMFHISYALAMEPEDAGVQRYGKGPKDLLFLAFYIIVFSLVRQTMVIYVVRPLAIKCGIRGQRKIERFTEQGYALFYWSSSSIIGLYVMSQQPTWWYRTEAFWLEYPHWRMRGVLKTFYLLQLSYWLQQLLVLALRIEKPRSDYVELCLHHIVTLWLVGWSYTINLTYIGVAIFFSMDIADVFLAFSKLLNYSGLQRTSECTFACLLCVWAYFRHYQNLRILHSVWYEYGDLVPAEARVFDLLQGRALAPWMRYQVFLPILALQCLNLFWYGLMWRIVWRMISGKNATDVREADEDEEEHVQVAQEDTAVQTRQKAE